MKKKLLLAICVLVLVVTSALVAIANARGNVHFIDTAAPGFCDFPLPLPTGCSATVTGTICRSNGNQFTYYKESACTSPYYRMQ